MNTYYSCSLWLNTAPVSPDYFAFPHPRYNSLESNSDALHGRWQLQTITFLQFVYHLFHV